MSEPRSSGALPSIDQWIAGLTGKSNSTREYYARDIRQIADILAGKLCRKAEISDILAMDGQSLRTLADAWTNDGDAPSTIRRRLVSLRRYARFLAAEFQLTGPLLYSDFPIVEVAVNEPVPEDHLHALVPNWAGSTSLRNRRFFRPQVPN